MLFANIYILAVLNNLIFRNHVIHITVGLALIVLSDIGTVKNASVNPFTPSYLNNIPAHNLPLHHLNTWYQTIHFCSFLLHLQSTLLL